MRMRNTAAFIYGTSVDGDMVDEHGRVNYDSIEDVFEMLRYRLCHRLGVRRSKLRKKLGIGFFAMRDRYKHRKLLKEDDVICFVANIAVVGRTKVIVGLKIYRWCDNCPSGGFEVTSEATYTMEMIDFRTGRFIPVSGVIVASIREFNTTSVHFNRTNSANFPPRERPS